MADKVRPDGPDEGNAVELPFLLLGAFRSRIDELHAELAENGHPGVRPSHGFAMQAVAGGANTASSVGHALGVSKQAAGKTLEQLDRLGYLVWGSDPSDARRKSVSLSDRGVDCLRRSAAILRRQYADFTGRVGAEDAAAMVRGLRALGEGAPHRLDGPGWLG